MPVAPAEHKADTSLNKKEKALLKVKAAVASFQEHLRKERDVLPGRQWAFALAPKSNPAMGTPEFWRYAGELDRFAGKGGLTHGAALAIARAFGGPVVGREKAMAYLTENGVPLYWAHWALAL